MSSGKILLCEDNDMVIHMTRFALESEGFEVETVSNTSEVFDRIKSVTPDIILLDLNLPVDGGSFVMKKLKSEKETENIPVVLFSGEDKLPEISEKLKADGYIQKPYGVNDLIGTIQKFIPKYK